MQDSQYLQRKAAFNIQELKKKKIQNLDLSHKGARLRHCAKNDF